MDRALRVLYRCAVLYTVVSVLSLLATGSTVHEYLFAGLGNLRMMPPFADLRAITATAGCQVDLGEVARGIVDNCDEYGRNRGLGYPPLSFWIFRKLGLGGGSTEIYGSTVGLLMVGSIHWCSREARKTGQGNIAAAILMAGFPIALAIERGNIDGTIFLGLLAIGWLVDRRTGYKELQFTRDFLACSLAFILAGAKIYPGLGIVAWCAWTLGRGHEKEYRGSAKLICIAALAGLASTVPWMLTGDQAAKPGVGIISHGLAAQIGSGEWGLIGGIASYTFFVSTIIACLWSRGSIGRMQNAKENGRRIVISTGGWITCACWLGCFVASTSYDYRIILVYPTAIGLIGNWKWQRWNRAEILVGLTIVLQVTTPTIYMVTYSALVPKAGGGADLIQTVVLLMRYSGFWLNRVLDVCLLPITAGILVMLLFNSRQSELGPGDTE